jgi:hypothetical protein
VSWFDRVINAVGDSARDSAAAADRSRRRRALEEKVAVQEKAIEAAQRRVGGLALAAHRSGSWTGPPAVAEQVGAIGALESRRDNLRSQLAAQRAAAQAPLNPPEPA